MRRRAIVAVNAVLLATAIGLMTSLVVYEASALTTAAAGGLSWQTPGPWVDWRTYADATERMLSGQPIFAAAQLNGPYQLTKVVLIGYAYPPPSAVLFLPFVSYPFGLAAFLTLNLGLLFTAMWAIITTAWRTYRVPIFAVALIALALNAPFEDGLISANVNLGLAGLVGWVAVGLSSPGVVGGIGAIVKVFPGALALTGTRKVRDLGIAIAVAGGVSLITLPLVGIGSWTDFVRAMTSAVPDCYPGNDSIACTVGPVIGLTNATLLGYGLCLAAGLAMFLVRDRLRLAILATIVILAPTTNLHPHYWLIVYVVGLAAAGRLSLRLRALQVAQTSPSLPTSGETPRLH